MKMTSQLLSGCLKAFSCVSLSILPLVLSTPVHAQEQSPAKSACQSALSTPQKKSQVKQPQKIAQFQDNTSQERSLLVQQANNLYNQRNFPGAQKALCQLVKKYPKDTFAHYQLGNVFARLQQPEAAISSYREAIRINSRYALAYNAIGAVYANQSRWDEAITEFKKALEINPEYGDALINYGQVLWQINQREQAQASLEKALNIFKKQQRNEKVYQVEQILQRLKTSDNPGVS
ncbi:tetratricopeptide repeat protein [Aliinostoc sp. HNIBRCY26]|uniref:tetratricopeptide repeat protein n=1 Tax=Aliinostoc sp. HNIBRCY26 TaxID=3418997 RepID=UPI003D05F804